MPNLHKQGMPVTANKGTQAVLIKNTTYVEEAAIAHATDFPGRLYVGDSNNRYQPVLSMDRAVVHNNDVVCHNGNIIYV